jgi:choline-sulfatase
METISHNRCVGKVLTRNAAVCYKSVLYEESVRIPFILSQKGVIPAGIVDDEHLVSNGLDLLPTLCDAANIRFRTD